MHGSRIIISVPAPVQLAPVQLPSVYLQSMPQAGPVGFRVHAPQLPDAAHTVPVAALQATVMVVSELPRTQAPVPAHVPMPQLRVRLPVQKPVGTEHAPSVQVRQASPVGS